MSKRTRGNSPQDTASGPHACLECLRRSWLLAILGPYLEKATSNSDGTEIENLLRLPNEKLIQDAAFNAAAQINARIEAMTEQHLQEELKLAECWACCRHSDLFPAGLTEHGLAAPHALIGRGDVELLKTLRPDRLVTVVGTRFATSEGRDTARRLGSEISNAGLTVVGPLDFGIASSVLQGALDGKEGGPAVALLSTGPDVAYPASLREVWGQICKSGLVLSELPPGTSPWNWSIRARGRIMAAIAGTTVVVESEAGSHSSQMAVLAAALGRRVAAVPSDATAAKGLLGLGASPIRSAEDLTP